MFEIIVAVLLALVLASSLTVYGLRSWVQTRSEAIQALRHTNHRFAADISPLPPISRQFVYRAASKRDFDRVDLQRFTAECILEQESLIDHDIRTRHHRLLRHWEYEQQVRAHRDSLLLGPAAARRVPKALRAIEEKSFESEVLPAPIPEADIRVMAQYSSPQGRNRYSKDRHLNYPELVDEVVRARRVRDSRATTRQLRQRERELMTDQLRVDILRRDGGRCRFCGTSASDGAVLHIDHIVPVSHGGRTLSSNLQVLCQPCNMGKGARFVG